MPFTNIPQSSLVFLFLSHLTSSSSPLPFSFLLLSFASLKLSFPSHLSSSLPLLFFLLLFLFHSPLPPSPLFPILFFSSLLTYHAPSPAPFSSSNRLLSYLVWVLSASPVYGVPDSHLGVTNQTNPPPPLIKYIWHRIFKIYQGQWGRGTTRNI